MEIGALRGFDADEEPYFDRLDEQVDRLLASIDAAANAMGMLLDLQLNERAYVVSVVATIFVPLTFITGFFGMNFGWMVDQIDTPGRLLAARVHRPDRDGGAVVAFPGAPRSSWATGGCRGGGVIPRARGGAAALAAARRVPWRTER